jgi:hypothetical protein
MTGTPLWQQQRDALQAEAQAAAPSTEEVATALEQQAANSVAEPPEATRLQRLAWGARGTETRKFALADYPNPYNPLGEWYTVGEQGPEQQSAPPLTRTQIAQDLARYGHDPSVLLREWDAFTQRIGYRAAQDRLQLGAAIYRPARPDETPDLWVSDAREGGDCEGYVRR